MLAKSYLHLYMLIFYRYFIMLLLDSHELHVANYTVILFVTTNSWLLTYLEKTYQGVFSYCLIAPLSIGSDKV